MNFENQLLEKILKLDEDLAAWFGKGPTGSSTGGGWDRYDSTGKKVGKCGDSKKGSPYAACLGKKYAQRLRSKGGKKAIANWVKRKRTAQRKSGHGKKGVGTTGRKPVRVSYKEELCEVFTIQNKVNLKNDLVQFLRNEFEDGDIKAVHHGLSTTEYKPSDWYEDMADNLINRLIQYFQTTTGQTERDM